MSNSTKRKIRGGKLPAELANKCKEFVTTSIEVQLYEHNIYGEESIINDIYDLLVDGYNNNTYTNKELTNKLDNINTFIGNYNALNVKQKLNKIDTIPFSDTTTTNVTLQQKKQLLDLIKNKLLLNKLNSVSLKSDSKEQIDNIEKILNLQTLFRKELAVLKK
jgi:outer membrane protein OmpA-like peptidoglycan-associated protein